MRIWRLATSWFGCDSNPGQYTFDTFRVSGEEVGDSLCVLARALHAQVEGFDAPENQETILRTRDSATGILNEVESLRQFRILYNQTSVYYIRVAAYIFGGRVQHDIRAEIERVLQVRRGECIVNAHHDAVFFGDFTYCGDVHNIEHGIGWGFHPYQSGIRAYFAFQIFRIIHINEAAFQPPLSPHPDHLTV
jgi:hypothetical protein